MKKIYSVQFEQRGEIVSDFQLEAVNLVDAKRLAQSHKRATLQSEAKRLAGRGPIKTTVKFVAFIPLSSK